MIFVTLSAIDVSVKQVWTRVAVMLIFWSCFCSWTTSRFRFWLSALTTMARWLLGTTILYMSWHSLRTLMTLLPFLMFRIQKQLQHFGVCCLWYALDFAVIWLLLKQWSLQVVLPDCEQLCPMLRWVSACFLKALCNFLSICTQWNRSTSMTLKCW